MVNLKIEVLLVANGFMVSFSGWTGFQEFRKSYIADDMKAVAQILDQAYAEFVQVGRQAQKAGEA